MPIRFALAMMIAAFIWPAGARAGAVVSTARADELLAQRLPADPWTGTHEAGYIAWSEAPVCQALLNLYLATHDRHYLDELVQRGRRILSRRDDRRGIADSTGKIHKAWSMDSKYVVAQAYLLDAHGKKIIRIRSTPESNNQLTQVQLTAHETRFDLRITNSFYHRDESFTDLSTDPTDPRYYEKIVNNPGWPNPKSNRNTVVSPVAHGWDAHATIPPTHSQLVRLTPMGGSSTLPRDQAIFLKPLPLAFNGYVGVIYWPLLQFAELVRTDPELKNYTDAAEQFTRAAEESYQDIKYLWRDGPQKDEGYYLTCLQGQSFPFDNVPEPFNYLGKHTASELALYRLTGKPYHLDHARKMAQLFKDRLKYNPTTDSYSWLYWYEPITTGWKRGQVASANVPQCPPLAHVEDISHGALDLQLAIQAYKAGIVFNRTDMCRFCNTFLRNVLLPDGTHVHSHVDGTGEQGKYWRAVAGWLPLSQFDPSIYAAIKKFYLANGQEDYRFPAALLRWKPEQ